MKITLCASATFFKDVTSIEKKLVAKGYKVEVPATARKMEMKNDYVVAHYKTWFKDKNYNKKTELIDEHFRKIRRSDAILIINRTKNNIRGYIGGSVFAEMVIAYYFGKKIFILNAISPRNLLHEEIMALNPIFLRGDLSRISNRNNWKKSVANKKSIKTDKK